MGAGQGGGVAPVPSGPAPAAPAQSGPASPGSAPSDRPRVGVVGAVVSVGGLTLVSRTLGFVRWVVQASTVGAGMVAGAYATANQVPNVLYEVVVGGALAATVVPLLAGAVQAGDREHAERTAGGLLGLVLAVLTPLAVLLAVAAGPLAALFPVSQGADPAVQHALVAQFLRMFALQVPLYGVGVVLTGVLQAFGSFTWPTLTPVASSLTVMATYALYGHLTAGGPPSALALEVLGWGTTLGVAALSLPLAWPVARLGIRLRPRLRMPRGELSRVVRLGGAGTWTLLTQQASVLAVLAMARAGGEPGTVAVYQYTQAVYLLPYAVTAVPVATVVYPRLAAALAEARPRSRDLAAQATALVAAVAVAGAGALVAVAPACERFFSLLTDVDGMAASLIALAPGLVGYALIYQVTRVLFAADAPRSGALATGAGWLVVVVASAAAVRVAAPSGGDGPATLVALGTGLSAGTTAAGVGLLVALRVVLGRGVASVVLRVLAVASPLAACLGALGWWVDTRVLGWADAAARPGTVTVVALGVGILAALVVAGLVLAGTCLVRREILVPLRSRSE